VADFRKKNISLCSWIQKRKKYPSLKLLDFSTEPLQAVAVDVAAHSKMAPKAPVFIQIGRSLPLPALGMPGPRAPRRIGRDKMHPQTG